MQGVRHDLGAHRAATDAAVMGAREEALAARAELAESVGTRMGALEKVLRAEVKGRMKHCEEVNGASEKRCGDVAAGLTQQTAKYVTYPGHRRCV